MEDRRLNLGLEHRAYNIRRHALRMAEVQVARLDEKDES